MLDYQAIKIIRHINSNEKIVFSGMGSHPDQLTISSMSRRPTLEEELNSQYEDLVPIKTSFTAEDEIVGPVTIKCLCKSSKDDIFRPLTVTIKFLCKSSKDDIFRAVTVTIKCL